MFENSNIIVSLQCITQYIPCTSVNMSHKSTTNAANTVKSMVTLNYYFPRTIYVSIAIIGNGFIAKKSPCYANSDQLIMSYAMLNQNEDVMKLGHNDV